MEQTATLYGDAARFRRLQTEHASTLAENLQLRQELTTMRLELRTLKADKTQLSTDNHDRKVSHKKLSAMLAALANENKKLRMLQGGVIEHLETAEAQLLELRFTHVDVVQKLQDTESELLQLYIMYDEARRNDEQLRQDFGKLVTGIGEREQTIKNLCDEAIRRDTIIQEWELIHQAYLRYVGEYVSRFVEGVWEFPNGMAS
jgi:chromosome segregation ATPase